MKKEIKKEIDGFLIRPEANNPTMIFGEEDGEYKVTEDQRSYHSLDFNFVIDVMKGEENETIGSMTGYKIAPKCLISNLTNFLFEMDAESGFKEVIASIIIDEDFDLIDDMESIFVLEDIEIKEEYDDKIVKKAILDNLEAVVDTAFMSKDIGGVMIYVEKENLSFYLEKGFEVIEDSSLIGYLVFKKTY
jgi:hypothetical protein